MEKSTSLGEIHRAAVSLIVVLCLFGIEVV
jgi:hypothetical protein